MIEFRTIGFPEHLMQAETASFKLSNIQISSGSQVSNFVRAAGLVTQRWNGKFDTSKMEREDWQEWDSFVARIAGQSVLFEIHAPAQDLPLGIGAGFTVSNPAYTITGTSITGTDIRTGGTTGLVLEDQARYAQAILIDFGVDQASEVVLKHGDNFGLGGNLYKCVGNVTADASGHGRVPFRWKLHKAAHEGDIVQLRKPTFRAQFAGPNEGAVDLSAPDFGKSSLSFMEVPYTQ